MKGQVCLGLLLSVALHAELLEKGLRFSLRDGGDAAGHNQSHEEEVLSRTQHTATLVMALVSSLCLIIEDACQSLRNEA
jgi:hypothetical protein